MLSKQITQSNGIVKRGRGRLRNLLSALAIAAVIAAAAAAIPRIFTLEPSPFLLDLLIKRLLMLTIVKALRCINNCTAAFAAANTAFENFLALDAAFSRGVASSPSGLASKGFKSNLSSFASFAFAFKTFNLNIAFIRLNGLVAANRSPVTRSASSILPFPFALALAAFVAFVAFAAFVAFVVFIIVALFALVIALAALAAALAVVITPAKRRAKVKRLLKALVNLLL
ncbi:hypothetical protein MBM_08398 [Drepanopeziza brunnea f. sp. 'multigermtubi' MB_m1]|uniref:Uncharacterized protein n=1 Tax=Marssonina brunnea f. sp. multigermtubi (strain MB_m1) TaxID=1072389 RepID=K1W829_MARBU|nr:uncharacterized protein MBM_08398 [Drepanopeziza brunnea f. sp. 'multigermtubi' MB_m1]EKD13315.1 hypothetical protein MBM_08398 [Drepanopeziza brunnea f. sp. 'multigermtubi' MB_m1]